MAGKDVTILAQALDGTWQTIGGESARGVFPSDVVYESDQWGSLAASFNLRRDPRAFWPDITAFTPIEIYVAGTLVWSGRVKETPSQVAQRVMNVQCEGWQFHLDDDIYQRTYVHADLTAWKDAHSVLAQDLTIYTQAGSVTAGAGAIVLGWSNGTILGSNQAAGVTLDLGPGNTAESIVVDFQGVTGPANSGASVYVRSTPIPDEGHNAGVYSDAISFTLATLGTNPSTNPGTFATPYRYLTIFLYAPSAVTLNADVSIQIKGIRVFADDTYRSGNSSALKASTVVRDALTRATVLLSSDLSGIDDTSLDITSYAPERKTTRQAWTAVDAYHDWMKKIDVDRKPLYRAKPSRPIFEAGVWSAINDDDASANSGGEIYSRADIGFTGPSGTSDVRGRFHGHDGSGAFSAIDAPSFANPSFDTNTTGWALTGAGTISLVRTTSGGDVDTPPAAGKVTAIPGFGPSSSVAFLTTTLTGTAERGRVHRITARVRTAISALPDEQHFSMSFGPAAGGRVTVPLPNDTGGGFISARVLWVPSADEPSPVLRFFAASGLAVPAILIVDSVQCDISAASLVDRRGFTRAMSVPIQSTLPDDGIAADAIGDVWMNAHRTTPFRGTVTLVGDESLRDPLTGAQVPLETLPLNTVQLIRFSDRSDPDTAGHGRDGRIAHVSYTPATNTAVVTIDNSRTSFDALLARNAVIQGG